EYQDLSLVSFAQLVISIAYSWKGDAARALEHIQIAVEKAPTPGDKAFAQTWLGIALCRADRAREAADLLGSILPLYEATQWVPGQVFARAYRGEAYLRLGELDDAEQTVQKGLDLALRCGMKYYVGYLQRILGEVALKRNPEQLAEPLAGPHFQASISVLRDIKSENELALAYTGHGRVHKHQGRTAEARDYFARALEIFEQRGTLVEPDKVRAELAALPATS